MLANSCIIGRELGLGNVCFIGRGLVGEGSREHAVVGGEAVLILSSIDWNGCLWAGSGV